MTPADNPLPEPPSSLKDWRDIPYGPGTRIFYPFMLGRSCFMAEGTVKSIAFVKEDMNSLLRHMKQKGELRMGLSENWWERRYEQMVKGMRIKVVIEVTRRNSRRTGSKNEVTITRLDNITVVPR